MLRAASWVSYSGAMTKNHAIATESWEAAWAEDLACFSGRAARATKAVLSRRGISPQMLRKTDVAGGLGQSKALKTCRILSRGGKAAALPGTGRRSIGCRDHGFDGARRILLFLVVAMLALIFLAAPARAGEGPAATAPTTEPWSKEKAWQWYHYQPWPCGFNYVPANAISYTEMWQDYAFEPERIDREIERRLSSLAPLLRGEGWGEGLSRQTRTRG